MKKKHKILIILCIEILILLTLHIIFKVKHPGTTLNNELEAVITGDDSVIVENPGKKKSKSKKKEDSDEVGISGKIGSLDEAQSAEEGGNPEEAQTEEISTVTDAGSLDPDVEEIEFKAHAVSSTEPTNLLLSTDIIVDDVPLENKDDYASKSLGDISFDLGYKYTDQEGVFTFRGNNFRDNPTYGRSTFTKGGMTTEWSVNSGSLTYGDATWSGSGWTGQPLLRRWSRETKAHMNMYDWAKEDDSLVEVIYACMDGYIYFLDMKTGEKTRDSLWLGFTFKGAGALDPRGYPIMYVGAGYDSAQGTARSFIINLLDCSVMYTFGNNDPYSLRGNLSYFDSSAVVDVDTDTLIYPGENGILYLIHLGTKYDEKNGTLSMDLDKMVRWRYSTKRNSQGSYWLGMETSAAIYKNYLFVADNGANLFCIDLNTLKTVWVQDILDDSNSTPVLSMEDGELYIYVSTSFHLGWRSSTTATIPIWKIKAETGEIVWQTEYECNTIAHVSGGVQSTIAVGKADLKDNIYVTVAMSHGTGGGDIVALSKKDGSKVWENQIAYTWSSPVCVYNQKGEGEVIYGGSDGVLRCLDGHSGEEKSYVTISDGTIEASPAVFEDYLIIGTRAGKIWGVHLD